MRRKGLVRVNVEHFEFLTGRFYCTLDSENGLARRCLAINETDLVEGEASFEESVNATATAAQFVQLDSLDPVSAPRTGFAHGSG